MECITGFLISDIIRVFVHPSFELEYGKNFDTGIITIKVPSEDDVTMALDEIAERGWIKKQPTRE